MASTQSDKSDEETGSEEDEQAEAEESQPEAQDQAEDGSESDGSDSDEDSDEDGEDSDEGSDEPDDETSSDDAGADDSDSDAGASPAGASASKAAKGGKARVSKKDGLTAGARLAAAKAAKAARKAAKRGKEMKEQDPVAQVRDSQLAKKAQEAGSWAAQNVKVVIAVAAGLLLGIAGWAGWSSYSAGQAEEAGALLADAVEIAQAEIVAEEEPAAGEDAEAAADAEEPDPDAPPTFPTEQARAEASLEAYRRVLTQYPGSDAAIWARLGEARALAGLGRHEEAREAYEAAEREGGSDPSVALRALEGRAFSFESEEEWDQALQVYERLASVDGQRYQPIAEYHRARMYIAKGERERATETLRELVEGLGQAEDDDAEQDFSYVLAQAETRLRELDPSAAPPPRANESPLGGLGGPGGQMSNEQLQELIRQFQQKQLQEQQGGGTE